MKLNIDSKALNISASRTQNAITDKSLSSIGIKAQNGQIQLFACDKVLSIYSALSGAIEAEGEVFVPGKFFLDVVRQLPAGNVSLQTTGSFVVMRGGSTSDFSVKIPIVSEGKWIEPPVFNSANRSVVIASRLKYMIEQTQFAIEQDSPRSFGSVGYMHKSTPNRLRLVASDGYRLSYCEAELDMMESFLPDGVCLSKRTVSEISRMLSEGFDRLEITVADDANTIWIKADDYSVYSRLSAIQYPRYLKVIPQTSPHKVVMSKGLVYDSVKRVLLAADDKKVMRLTFASTNLNLSSSTAGSSEGKEDIPLEGGAKDETSIMINGRYLSEIFYSMQTPELSMEFSDKFSPMVVTPCNEVEGCFSQHVLMPITER